jgi:serine/threonine protein kinase
LEYIYTRMSQAPLQIAETQSSERTPSDHEFETLLACSEREEKQMDTATAVSGRWTRVRTLGRGASGAVVSLAADDLSGALFAVKSAPARAAGAEQLRREGHILSGLSSPHVLPCLGFRSSAAGECQLFLEFAPGGSVADVAERCGGRLQEAAIRAYAADMARGLAYLHGRSLVHGDVKARNVVVGADGRAKIADFGGARAVNSDRPIGGTPAFMAPEVARGEEQGPASDVWALGCTVVEMATGRAPWSDVDDNVLAAMRRIGYTDAVPEAPAWLSAEAKHFLSLCFARDARDRCTAAQLLEHPFLVSAGCGVKPDDEMTTKWVSPKSTLDAALWEESDAEDEDVSESSPVERIRALASTTCSTFPEWDSDDEGWIDVVGESCEEASDAATEKAGEDDDECVLTAEALEMVVDFSDAYVEDSDREPTVGLTALLVEQREELCSGFFSDPPVFFVSTVCESEITESLLRQSSSPH